MFQLGNSLESGGEAIITRLTMTNGHATDGGSGGGIHTYGALTLKRVVVKGSDTSGFAPKIRSMSVA